MSWKTDETFELLPYFRSAMSFFDVGEPLSTERIGGHANKNYRVTTARGAFVFKLVREHTLRDLKTEVAYLDRLQDHGFPAAYYRRSPEGLPYYLDPDGTILLALPELPGKSPDPTPAVCRQVGAATARLHGIPAAGLPPRSHWLRRDYLPDVIDAIAGTRTEDAARLAQAHAGLAAFPYDALPATLVHGDLSPSNCLFRDADLLAYLDWEEVGTAPAVLDLAVCLLNFCLTDAGEWLRENSAQLLTGYQETRPLSADEREHLPSAVRFAGLTCTAWHLLQFGIKYPDPELVQGWTFYWDRKLDDLALP